jgi:hypothetical protein
MSPKRLEKTTERHAGQFRPRIVTLEHFNYAQEVIKYFHNVHVVTKKQIMRANRVLFGMKCSSRNTSTLCAARTSRMSTT